MAEKKYFAIGDVHGCVDQLRELIAKLPLTASSEIVFLGDYIDRGPDSRAVIDEIIKLKQKFKVTTLLGNHESMLKDFLERPESVGAALFIMNGGGSTLASYSEEAGHFDFPADHIQFFNDCLPYYETEDYFFVHAGLRNKPLAKASLDSEETLLWIREAFLKSTYDWGKKIIHGHTPVNEPTIKNNRINLDTGCVFGGSLTAIELPRETVYQVPGLTRESRQLFRDDQDHSSRRAKRFEGAIEVFVVKGARVCAFETLNYNEIGLLIRENPMAVDAILKKKEIIEGVIGQDPKSQVSFTGEVVRADDSRDQRTYGVRILELKKN